MKGIRNARSIGAPSRRADRPAARRRIIRFAPERRARTAAPPRSRALRQRACHQPQHADMIARLREAQEHPDWRWERERRQSIRNRIETLRPAPRKSQVPVTPELQNQMDTLANTGLPASIQFL